MMNILSIMFTDSSTWDAEKQALEWVKQNPLQAVARIAGSSHIPIANSPTKEVVVGIGSERAQELLDSPRWHIDLSYDRQGEAHLKASIWFPEKDDPYNHVDGDGYALTFFDFQLVSENEDVKKARAQWQIDRSNVDYLFGTHGTCGRDMEVYGLDDMEAESAYNSRKQQAKNHASIRWEKHWDGRGYKAEWNTAHEWWDIQDIDVDPLTGH